MDALHCCPIVLLAHLVTHVLNTSLHVIRPKDKHCHGVAPSRQLDELYPPTLVFQVNAVSLTHFLCWLHSLAVLIPSFTGPVVEWVLPDPLCHWVFFRVGFVFLFLPIILISSTYTLRNKPFSRCNTSIPIQELSPSLVVNMLFLSFRHHNNPTKGCPYKILSNGTEGSGITVP